MNPVLRKIKKTSSRSEVIERIKKHIGSDPQFSACKEAYEAVLKHASDDMRVDMEFYYECHVANEMSECHGHSIWRKTIESFIGL